MTARTIVRLSLPFILVVLIPVRSWGDVNRYVEDFRSTQFKDVTNTTADWDTTSLGYLRLPPYQPSVVGKHNIYAINSRAYGVAVAGNYAFLCDGSIGLKVLDISDPTTPTLVGSTPSVGSAYQIVLAGDHAYVACSTGLQVLDISDPTTPTQVGFYTTANLAFDVALQGNRAFLAAGGLEAVDISDPTSPVTAGSYTTPGWSRGVAVAGRYAYVAHEDGLLVFLVAPPSFSLAADLPLAGDPTKLDIQGDLLYVSGIGAGVHVVDISSPTSPVRIGGYDDASSAGYGLAVDGDYLYLADGPVNKFQGLDVSTPASPSALWTVDMKSPQSVAVAGDYAFVADEDSGLVVVRVRESAGPVYVGSYDSPGVTAEVFVHGDHAYLADGAQGLRVVDVTNPGAPVSVGAYDTPYYAENVVVVGDYAYVADYQYGLYVINVTTPTAPSLTGNYDTPGNARGLDVEGRYAFVADADSGMQVIDVGVPSAPVSVGRYYVFPIDVRCVAVEGDLAYVSGAFGLQILDVSDPTTPALEGSSFWSGIAVAVDGDYAFLAGTSGLHCFDVSNPSAPVRIGFHATPGEATDVAVSGDYVFITDITSSVHAFDVSDPADPILLDSHALPHYGYGLDLAGDNVFVGVGSSGLYVASMFQRVVSTDRNVGRSLEIDGRDDTIAKARLATVQADTVDWELSVDGGSSWLAAEPGADWVTFGAPGNDLRWRSRHAMGPSRNNPYCLDLTIEWLYAFPVIEAVADVPDDQGGWVRVQVTRSGYDFADESLYPITQYYLWHRVDDPLLVHTVAKAAKHVALQTPQAPALPAGIAIAEWQGRHFHTGGDGPSMLPPGTWEIVGSMPGAQQDTYIHLTPTTADSTVSGGVAYSVYLVTAHTTTPSVWFASPPDSGYSVDNIAPGAPQGLLCAYNTGSGNALSWEPSVDGDFQHFAIYRGTTPDFTPGVSNRVHATAAPAWTDPEYDGWDVYYKVTAVDHAGNESDPSAPDAVTATDGAPMPITFALYQNVPNPFNPTTKIRYDVPAGGADVQIVVYDVVGRRVRTLVDGHAPAGSHVAFWDARDDRGAVAPTGVYFYRMTAGAFTQTQRMVLLK